jgi:hypothetical protein
VVEDVDVVVEVVIDEKGFVDNNLIYNNKEILFII